MYNVCVRRRVRPCARVHSQRRAPAATMALSSCVIVRQRRAATGHRGVLLGSPSAPSASTGITMGRSAGPLLMSTCGTRSVDIRV